MNEYNHFEVEHKIPSGMRGKPPQWERLDYENYRTLSAAQRESAIVVERAGHGKPPTRIIGVRVVREIIQSPE